MQGARTQMIHAEALPLLVNILKGGSTASKEDAALLAATQRTLSKAAIATARLCLDPASADTVVRLGGLDRLVDLARGNVHTVKIAALAAVKTVSIYCSASLNIDLETLIDTEKGNNLEVVKGGCGEYYTTETPISSLESFV